MSRSRYESWRANFGTNVRRARELAGMTQADLAVQLADLGFTRDKVTKLERGTRPTSAEEVVAIAEAVAVPPAILLEVDSWSRVLGDLESLSKHLQDARSAVIRGASDFAAWKRQIDEVLPRLEQQANGLVEERSGKERGIREHQLRQATRSLQKGTSESLVDLVAHVLEVEAGVDDPDSPYYVATVDEQDAAADAQIGMIADIEQGK